MRGLSKRVGKFIKLTGRERVLFLEALFLHLWIGLLLKAVPFRWIPRLFASRQSAVSSRQLVRVLKLIRRCDSEGREGFAMEEQVPGQFSCRAVHAQAQEDQLAALTGRGKEHMREILLPMHGLRQVICMYFRERANSPSCIFSKKYDPVLIHC